MPIDISEYASPRLVRMKERYPWVLDKNYSYKNLTIIRKLKVGHRPCRYLYLTLKDSSTLSAIKRSQAEQGRFNMTYRRMVRHQSRQQKFHLCTGLCWWWM